MKESLEAITVVYILVHNILVKKIVLDVLKPHQPEIPELASRLVGCHGVDHVGISLAEIDQNTESIKIQVEGTDIKIDAIRECIEHLGATIHSIDEVEVFKKPTQK